MDQPAIQPSPAQPTGRPDAIKFPTGWSPPAGVRFDGVSRADKLLNFFEPILGGGPGKPGHIRQLAGGPIHMVTLSTEDTVNFPTGHPMEKFPRYTWVRQPNGLEYGYLKPEAQVTQETVPVHAAARAARNAQAEADMAAWRECHAKMERACGLLKLGPTIGPELKQELDRLDAELSASSEMWRVMKEQFAARAAQQKSSSPGQPAPGQPSNPQS
jgi:hypothetical protein